MSKLVKEIEEFKNIKDGKYNYIYSSLTDQKVDKHYLESMGIEDLETYYRNCDFEKEYKIHTRELWCIEDEDGKRTTPFSKDRRTDMFRVSDFRNRNNFSFYKSGTLFIPASFFVNRNFFELRRGCTDEEEYLFQVNNLETVKVDNLNWNERIILSVDKDLNLETHKVESHDLFRFWENLDKEKIWMSNRTLKPAEDFFLKQEEFYIENL